MLFSASKLRFVQLLFVLFGVAFFLFKLRPSITAPTQQVWGDRHDWDDFDAIRNETLGVIISLQATPGDLAAHNHLVSKSLRH